MIIALVWLAYLAGAVFNLHLLRRIDMRRLDFMDGVLIGHAYFIIIPMFFMLLMGESTMPDIGLRYRPYEDLKTTAVLIEGMFVIGGMRLLLRKVSLPPVDLTSPRLLRTLLITYVASTMMTFAMVGLSSGGHWQASLESAFSNNPLVVIIKYVSNYARNAIFGVLLYGVVRGTMARRHVLAIGLLISLVDVFVTFNRITAMYFLVLVLLSYRRNRAVFLAIGIGSLVALPSLSVIFPMFRGLATQQGYTVDGFIRAWSIASQARNVDRSLDSALNSVFESSNIVVLNWIVYHAGVTVPLLKGEVFVRAFSFFLPKFIWSSRPDTFNLIMGVKITGIEGLALNSTAYGEPYGNFGALWFVPWALWLSFVHHMFKLLQKEGRAVGFMAAFAALTIWRFDAAYLVVAMVMTFFVLRMLKRSRPNMGRPALRSAQLPRGFTAGAAAGSGGGQGFPPPGGAMSGGRIRGVAGRGPAGGRGMR